jgi:hypothetical protein
MNQTFECNECGERQPSIFHVFLHIFTNHMHQDIALIPQESAELPKSCHEYDPAYYQLVYGVLSHQSNWIERN